MLSAAFLFLTAVGTSSSTYHTRHAVAIRSQARRHEFTKNIAALSTDCSVEGGNGQQHISFRDVYSSINKKQLCKQCTQLLYLSERPQGCKAHLEECTYWVKRFFKDGEFCDVTTDVTTCCTKFNRAEAAAEEKEKEKAQSSKIKAEEEAAYASSIKGQVEAMRSAVGNAAGAVHDYASGMWNQAAAAHQERLDEIFQNDQLVYFHRLAQYRSELRDSVLGHNARDLDKAFYKIYHPYIEKTCGKCQEKAARKTQQAARTAAPEKLKELEDEDANDLLPITESDRQTWDCKNQCKCLAEDLQPKNAQYASTGCLTRASLVAFVQECTQTPSEVRLVNCAQTTL